MQIRHHTISYVYIVSNIAGAGTSRKDGGKLQYIESVQAIGPLAMGTNVAISNQILVAHMATCTKCFRPFPSVPHRSLQHRTMYSFVPLVRFRSKSQLIKASFGIFWSPTLLEQSRARTSCHPVVEFVDHVLPTFFAESLVNRCQRNNIAGDGQGSKYLGRAPIIDICLELRTVSRIETLKGHELASGEEIQ